MHFEMSVGVVKALQMHRGFNMCFNSLSEFFLVSAFVKITSKRERKFSSANVVSILPTFCYLELS